MSKFNEVDYRIGRAFDDNNAPHEPPVAASATPNVQQDARTPSRATGRLVAMTNTARQLLDTRAVNRQSSMNQPSADARAAMMSNMANPATNILEGTPVPSNVSNDRWARTIQMDYYTPNFVADGGGQQVRLS